MLSKEEQREVISLFPSSQHIIDPDTDNARPDVAALKNDDNFRHDCARYKTDLQGGFHDKAWLAEAFVAYELRKSGFFDKYIIEAFESDWDIQLPDEYKPDHMRVRAGDDVDAGKSENTGRLQKNGARKQKDSIKTADVRGKEATGEAEVQPDKTGNGAHGVRTGTQGKATIVSKDEKDTKTIQKSNEAVEKEDVRGENGNTELLVKGSSPNNTTRRAGKAVAKSEENADKRDEKPELCSVKGNGD